MKSIKSSLFTFLKNNTYIIGFFEASLFVAGLVLAAFFPVVAAIACGAALAVISFREYGYQREVLKGKNKNTAIAVGYKHILLCSMIFITLLALAANPIFAPIIPFIHIAWGLGITISIVSALSAGGYEKLRHDWKQSGILPLKWIINGVDFILQFIPRPVANFLGINFARLHRVLGEVFFATQVAIFVIVGALIQPVLGLTALGYLGFSYLRTQNALPLFMVNGLERFDSWMGQVGGFFIPDPLMQLYSYYSLASSFILKFVSPMLANSFLGNESKILITKEPINDKKFVPLLKRSINKSDFVKLLENLPAPLSIKNDLRNGLEKDISDLYNEYSNFYAQYTKIKNRDIAYAKHKQLLATPTYLEAYKGTPAYIPAKINWYLKTGIYNYLKYAVDYVPMRAYWYFTTFWYSPRIPNQFLTMKTQENTYAINIDHLNAAPFILPEAPEVDFKEFIKEVKNSKLEEKFEIIRASCLDSPQFQSINLSVKEELVHLQIELNHSYKCRRELKDLVDTPANKALQAKALEEYQKIQNKINDANNKLVNVWRKALGLHETATEEEIFTAYILSQLEKVCNTIETGSGLGWDKSGKSLEDVQTAGKHVINFCYDTLVLAKKNISDGKASLEKLELELKQEIASLKSQRQVLLLEQSTLEGIQVDIRTLEQSARLLQIENDLFELEQFKLASANSSLAKIELGPHMYDLNIEESSDNIDTTLRLMALGYQNIGEMHSLIVQLAIDAGDYCAAGMSDAIFRKYDEYLANKFIEEANLPVYQKLALNMQCYRRNVFNGLYSMLAKHPYIKALFFHIDFYDQHDRAYIMHAVRSLCLDQHNIARSDSSKEGTDLLKEISAKLVAYTLIRLLISCENGYSPEGIINSGLLKSNETTCYKSVNRDVCLQEWKNSFNDDIAGYIDEVWMDGICAMGFSDAESQCHKEKVQKLLALMLLDNGVFELNHQKDKEAVSKLLEPQQHIETERTSNPQVSPEICPNRSVIFSEIPQTSTSMDFNKEENKAFISGTNSNRMC